MSFDRDRYKVDVLRAYLKEEGVPPPPELYQWPPDEGETAAAHIASVREYWHLQATKAGPVAMLCKRFLDWDRENGDAAVAALTSVALTAVPMTAADASGSAIADVAERCRRHDPVSASTGLINVEAFASAVAADGVTASDDELVRGAAQAGLRVQRPVDRTTIETALGLASRLPELNSQIRQAGVPTAAHLLRAEPSGEIGFANRQSISIDGREISEDDVHAAISRLDRKAVNTVNRSARTALRSLTSVVGTPALLDLVTMQAISAAVAPSDVPGPQRTLALIDELVADGFDRATAAVIAVKSPVAVYRPVVGSQPVVSQPVVSQPVVSQPVMSQPTPTPSTQWSTEAPPMVPRPAPGTPDLMKQPPPPVQPAPPTNSTPYFPPIAPQAQPPQTATWHPQPTPQPYPNGSPYQPAVGTARQAAPVWLWIATFVPIFSCFGIVTAVIGGIGMGAYTSGKPSRALLKVAAILEFVLGGLFALMTLSFLADGDASAVVTLGFVVVFVAAGIGHRKLSSHAA